MTGNNSCGARSIRYGNMVHNVRAIEAILASGERCRFGPVPGDLAATGTRLFAEVRGKKLPVTVAAMPFVKSNYKRA